MNIPKIIDMHMHTNASDGTDTPEEILQNVKDAGIGLFSVTDHDAIKSCTKIFSILSDGDPVFVSGVEFSCKDEFGKYHILGYGYDPNGSSIMDLVAHTHALRMEKVKKRLAALSDNYQIRFPDEEIEKLLALHNPGKPHIGNLMVKYGFVKSREEAIRDYLNRIRIKGATSIAPEVAIEAILNSGGVPVLAHPIYGDGSQLLDTAELNRRIRVLMQYGLMGLECYYSGFSPKEQNMMLDMADAFDLFVSAGSDYHGSNKLISLADTNLEDASNANPHLLKFLDHLLSRSQ